MEKPTIAKSNWDGQLPSHIANNEQMWWESVPQFTANLKPRLFGGGNKDLPSRRTIASVALVAWLKTNLPPELRGLFNDWGCYCQCLGNTEFWAGTITSRHLIFKCHEALFPLIILKFDNRIDDKQGYLELDRHEREIREMLLKNYGSTNEFKITLDKYQKGDWEKGLAITTKAAIWLFSNRDEALEKIWQHKSYLTIDGLSPNEIQKSNEFFESQGFTQEIISDSSKGAAFSKWECMYYYFNTHAEKEYWTYHTVASLSLYLGKATESIKFLTEAVQKYPNDPRVHYFLGTIYYGVFQSQQPLGNGFQDSSLLTGFKLIDIPGKEAARLALEYFRKVLMFDISPEDHATVNRHISSINAILGL